MYIYSKYQKFDSGIAQRANAYSCCTDDTAKYLSPIYKLCNLHLNIFMTFGCYSESAINTPQDKIYQ